MYWFTHQFLASSADMTLKRSAPLLDQEVLRIFFQQGGTMILLFSGLALLLYGVSLFEVDRFLISVKQSLAKVFARKEEARSAAAPQSTNIFQQSAAAPAAPSTPTTTPASLEGLDEKTIQLTPGESEVQEPAAASIGTPEASTATEAGPTEADEATIVAQDVLIEPTPQSETPPAPANTDIAEEIMTAPPAPPSPPVSVEVQEVAKEAVNSAPEPTNISEDSSLGNEKTEILEFQEKDKEGLPSQNTSDQNRAKMPLKPTNEAASPSHLFDDEINKALEQNLDITDEIPIFDTQQIDEALDDELTEVISRESFREKEPQ